MNKDRLSLLRTLDTGLARGEAAVLLLLTSALTWVVFLQVFFRYVFSYSLYWSEELARFLFVWLSVLGAALAVQKKGHFGFELLHRRLPEKSRKALTRIIDLFTAGMAWILFLQGIHLTQKTQWQESPAMGISMAWFYGALPVGAGLMAFHLLVALLPGRQEDSPEKDLSPWES